VPVVCLHSAEGAALGAAIQAAAAAERATGGASLEALADRLATLDETTRHQPDPARAALYAGQTDRFLKLTGDLHASGWI
jgi:xylulokinase